MIYVNGRLVQTKKSESGEIEPIFFTANFNKGKYLIEWRFENMDETVVIYQINKNIQEQGIENVQCVIPYFPYQESKSLPAVVEMLPSDWTYTVIEPHSDELSNQFEAAGLKYSIKYFNMGINQMDGRGLTIFPDIETLNRYLNNIDTDIEAGITEGLPKGEIYLVGSNNFQGYQEIDHQLALNVDGEIVLVDWDAAKTRKVIKDRLASEFGTFSVSILDDCAHVGDGFVELKKDFLDIIGLDSFEDGIKFSLDIPHMFPSSLSGELLDSFEIIYTTNSIPNGFLSLSDYGFSTVTVGNIRDFYSELMDDINMLDKRER